MILFEYDVICTETYNLLKTKKKCKHEGSPLNCQWGLTDRTKTTTLIKLYHFIRVHQNKCF